jgi:hypothetical protein
MDFDRWYRRAKKKADALFVQGIVVAIAALMLGNMLANIGKGAGDIARPLFEVFAWAPLLLFLVGAGLLARSLWTHRRLHDDPVALYEEG